jgi:uncharacterized membrane protein
MSGVASAMKVVKKADEVDYPKGLLAAGAALIALPYAAKGVSKLTGGSGTDKASELGEKVKDKAAGKATGKAKEIAGDVADEKMPGPAKGLKGLFGGGGSDDDSSSDGGGGAGGGSAAPGHGSGRRMPIQQSVDVAVPIKAAYNLWTQFENWPEFMHRVDQAEQVDDTTVSMSTKVWGITKRFQADIVEQRPDERIEWDASEGLSHTGVATFHKLAPRLTRIELTLDVEPDSLLEKAGRGMRFTKRAARGDLHRFKAFAELEEEADDGWRGTIEDGEVKRKTDRKSSRSQSSGRKSNGSKSSSRGSRNSGSRS